MKKKLILYTLLMLVGFSIHAQDVRSVPHSDEIKQLPDGWHKFALQGVTFDVEVKAGILVKGNLVWLDGSTYSGSLYGSSFSGKGTYTWPDGTRYEGAFKRGKRHGKGSLIQPDNTKWSGKWKEDKKHGKGKVYDASGQITQEGVWEANEFAGAKTK